MPSSTTCEPEPPLLTIVLAALLLAPMAGAAQTATVTDSAGVRIVVNEVPRWGSGGEWSISEEPTVRIGVLDGDPQYLFRIILDVARLADGTIVVLDQGSKELRFYSRAGDWISSLGGDGDGPGEFRGPWRVARFSGDTAIVWDFSRRTLSWFTPAGFLSQQRLRGPRTIHEGELTERGDRLIPHYPSRPTPSRPNSVHRASAKLIRIGPDSFRGDTLADFSYRELFASGPGMPPLTVPFARESYVSSGAHGDRVVVGDSESFDIQVFDGSNQLVMRIRSAVPERKVQPSEVDQYRSTLRARWSGSPQAGSMERALDQFDIHERVPAFTSLHVDPDGFVWAERYPEVPGDRVIAVFDDAGFWLGDVALPGGLVVHEIGLNYVLGVWKDELDVEYVRLHRLARD